MEEHVWRHAILIRLIGVRRAIYGISFAISVLAGAFAWHLNAPVAMGVAAALAFGSGIGYLNQSSEEKAVLEKFLKEP